MTRTASVLLAALLVVGTLAAFPATGLAAQTDETETGTPVTETEVANETANESENGSVAPGAQLSGVVGVGEAELEGDVESRAYGIQVAQAKTNEARADVVAERLGAIEQRLGELEQQKQELDEARANGSMSEGEYSAKVAAVHARTQSVERVANQTNETAQGLPADLLEAKGINATAIQTLKDRADELGGPETAAIARTIAGENVGQAAGPDAAGDRGQAPDDAGPGNETDRSQPGADRSQGNETGSQNDGTGSVGTEQTATESDRSAGNGGSGSEGGDDGQSPR